MIANQRGDSSAASSLLVDSSEVELELYFSCRKLADLDFISVTDSFVVGFVKEGNAEYKKVYETKVYNNDLNPDYYETLVLPFLFDTPQLLTLEVYHKENPPKLVGRVTVRIVDIYNTMGKKVELPLMDLQNKKAGTILIRMKELSRIQAKKVSFGLRIIGLWNPGCSFLCFGSVLAPKPFIRIKKRSAEENILVYESVEAQQSRSPLFANISMSESKLCDCNPNLSLVCQVWDYAESGNHKMMGSIDFTLNQVANRNQMNLMSNGQRLQARIIFIGLKIQPMYSMRMFLEKGMKLHLSVYIDFTSSNGQSTNPNSYHYIGSLNPTHYEKAIKAVARTLVKKLAENFDSHFGIWGFGAKVNMPNTNSMGKEHQCFPLNDKPSDPYVEGIEPLVAAYRNSIRYLKFGQRTLFSPFLNEAMRRAQYYAGSGSSDYLIALVLTDGELQDLPQTKDILVNCGKLPISVIMVGIGTGQFKLLEQLDDNYMVMTNLQGKKTERDLVTFVNFAESGYSEDQLAKEVMKELPRQIVDYCKLRDIHPEHIGHQQIRDTRITRSATSMGAVQHPVPPEPLRIINSTTSRLV